MRVVVAGKGGWEVGKEGEGWGRGKGGKAQSTKPERRSRSLRRKIAWCYICRRLFVAFPVRAWQLCKVLGVLTPKPLAMQSTVCKGRQFILRLKTGLDLLLWQVGEDDSNNHQIAKFSSFADYISRDESKTYFNVGVVWFVVLFHVYREKGSSAFNMVLARALVENRTNFLTFHTRVSLGKRSGKGTLVPGIYGRVYSIVKS